MCEVNARLLLLIATIQSLSCFIIIHLQVQYVHLHLLMYFHEIYVGEKTNWSPVHMQAVVTDGGTARTLLSFIKVMILPHHVM